MSKDELEEAIITYGLQLKLQSVRRKNPYFKGNRRGSDRGLKMRRKEKLAAMSFARRVVKAHFEVARGLRWLVSPN